MTGIELMVWNKECGWWDIVEPMTQTTEQQCQTEGCDTVIDDLYENCREHWDDFDCFAFILSLRKWLPGLTPKATLIAAGYDPADYAEFQLALKEK